MRKHAALLLLGIGALLLTPGAAGVPDVPGDPTPPMVTPVIAGTLGSDGWYRSNVTVNWSVTDPESIILSTTGCDARTLTSDTASLRLTCAGVSDGGETTVSKTFKVDKTAPATSVTPSRAADSNGWYNHDLTVGFAGIDATSGLESCSPAAAYVGPDTPGTTVSGNCRDRAGNTAPASFPLRYDETAPQTSPSARAPDANGWHNHALTIAFQGADGTSGVDTCTQVTYAGPDDPSVALTGTCVDRAGNQSTSAPFTFKYDETPPQASATASRPADSGGWYNHPLTVSFAGSDATSGLASCDAAKAYSGPDAASVSISGSCRDLAGNVAPRSVVVKYDGTAPQVGTTPGRAANANGWYNAPLAVTFTGADPMSGVASCVGPQSYSGPDNAAAAVAGSCTDQAGNVRNASFPLKFDATAPKASASPGRAADQNGWYNHSLAVTFSGTDATSGIGSCDPARNYSTPDSASASVSGTCLDRAGNQSSAATFGFKYDATPPQVTTTPARGANANGWYNAPLSVGFTGGDATSGINSCDPAKTYSGPDDGAATVSGACRDRAGNSGSGSYVLRYDATAPQATATPSRQPNTLGWHNAPLAVSFAGTDATAGIDSCDAAKSYSGPDSAGATLAGACRDKAGNAGTGSLLLRYDATAPQTSVTPARQPNANGWYNAPLSVSFTATDATAGVDSCDPAKSYTGPDGNAATVSGACRDKAGNAAAGTFTLRYDATNPLVTAAPARGADAGGWYNHPLSVGFTGGDAASGIESCDAAANYSGPDNPSVSIGGACRDKAGNLGTGSVAIKYDATGPATSATPSRQPNASGWYSAPVTVSFSAGDPVSGVASCPAAKSYGGPDSATASVAGTCLDNAGNGGVASLALKYDATAPQAAASPSRSPNAGGWFGAPVTVSFVGTDVTSGIESCTAPQTYAGPDTSATSVSGSCRDRAGNPSPSTIFGLKYDATAPVVTDGIAVRPPDQAGWYNRPVAFSLQGTDATSGIDSCPTTSYAGPDSAEASFSGACVDKAGNQGTGSFALRYDGTGPTVRPIPSREADSGGWYNHALTVSFAGEDLVSGLESCGGPESYEGPDSGLALVGGICLDKAGNVGLASFPLAFDATAPQVTGATPSRAPDAKGWYNRPLAVTFHGTDPTSTILACTEAAYSGPDAVATAVHGSCRDRAGNVSAAGSFALRYDATAPSLTGVRAKAGNRSAVLSWTASPDTTLIEIHRSGKLVYRGSGRSFTETRLENGVRYRYALSAYDEARNAARSAVEARPTAPLFSPPAGATVFVPPRLAWTRVEKATYYNVQVCRGGKILSAWPKRTTFQIPRRWTYGGRRYHLKPGRYHWFVWPGYGRMKARNYGKLLGSSSFVVAGRAQNR